MLLVNEKGEQIVSLAVPIQYRKAVQGVLLLSTRPGEIDEVLSEERNVIIALALTAFAATLLASFLLARTIAGPMRRLSEVAENVSRNIKARHELPELAAPRRRGGPDGHGLPRDDGLALSAHRGERALRPGRRPRAQEPAHRRPLDRRGAGLRQDARSSSRSWCARSRRS